MVRQLPHNTVAHKNGLASRLAPLFLSLFFEPPVSFAAEAFSLAPREGGNVQPAIIITVVVVIVIVVVFDVVSVVIVIIVVILIMVIFAVIMLVL